MNSLPNKISYNIDLIKQRCTLIDIWHFLGLEGSSYPGKAIRCIWPEKHRHGDKNPSCVVWKDGKGVHCYSCGYKADLIQLVCDTLKLSFREACAWLYQKLGIAVPYAENSEPEHISDILKRVLPTLPPVKNQESIQSNILAIPEELNIVFEEGCKRLSNDGKLCSKIDEWRGWKAGTSQKMAEDKLLSHIKIYNRSGLAFSVEAPYLDEFGEVSIKRVGFHFRVKPTSDNEKAMWLYYPNDQQHGQKTLPLPFVLGGGYLSTAKAIIILEGQWDTVCFSSQLGWLETDTSWPENIVIVGIPGKGAFKYFLDYYRRFIPREASFLLIPDKDAEEYWKDNFANSLVNNGFTVVWQCFSKEKDFTDAYRSSPEDVIINIQSIIDAAFWKGGICA